MAEIKKITIYHNPRCSKSRQALALLVENAVEPIVVEYLKSPYTKEQLRTLCKKLNMRAQDLIRKNETVYKERFADSELSEEEWIDAMVTHPILVERPIIENADAAVVGRPPERVMEIL